MTRLKIAAADVREGDVCKVNEKETPVEDDGSGPYVAGYTIKGLAYMGAEFYREVQEVPKAGVWATWRCECDPPHLYGPGIQQCRPCGCVAPTNQVSDSATATKEADADADRDKPERAATSGAVTAPPTVENRYTAWLIESKETMDLKIGNDSRLPRWLAVGFKWQPPYLHWTDNAADAMHFVRKQDADVMLKFLCRTKATRDVMFQWGNFLATEHIFDDGAAR